MSLSRKLPPAQYCCICHTSLVQSPHEVLKTYICSSCERQKQYGTPNRLACGQMGNLPTFSVEFEVAAPPDDPDQVRRALILLQHGYVRTYDATVDDEYKSPIYCSLQAFRKPLAVLDSLADLVTDRCGTHLHVGFNERYALENVRHEVFGPLIDYLREHEQQTIRFWGRTFSHQTQATLREDERHVCFNVGSRYQTIEYRLPRFRSADQYVRVLRFCRETTAFLSEALNPVEVGSKLLSPEQIGARILARYKKAAGACKQEHATAIPTLWTQQEVSPCVG